MEANKTATDFVKENNDASPLVGRGATPSPPLRRMTTTAFLTNSPTKRADVCGIMKGKMPAARDGHSAVLVGENMVVFGGDRHRMPFADLYALNVKNQLQGKNIN